MKLRRLSWLSLLLALTLLAVGCSSDEDGPEFELVYNPAYPVPMNDLVGTYGYDAEPASDPPRSRGDQVRIPTPVEDFRRLRFVASGSWSPGLVEVAYDFPGGLVVYDTFSINGYLELELALANDPEKIYRARIWPLGDDFTSGNILEADWPDGVVDAADLMSEDIDATLTCVLEIVSNERVLEPALGEVTSVTLELMEAEVLEEVPSGGWPDGR